MRNLTGMRFGRLVVQSFNHTERSGKKAYHYFWNCKCDCGKTVSTRADALNAGRTISCGCYQVERRIKANTKHGKCHTRLHRIWTGMKQRCYNPNSNGYKNYGGRGIKVCEKWLNNFSNFYHWALTSGYSENLTIDRIENDEDYSPDNCQWTTLEKQQAVGKKRENTRYVFIEHEGKRLSLEGWSLLLGGNHGLVSSRIKNGMDRLLAISKPVNISKQGVKRCQYQLTM